MSEENVEIVRLMWQGLNEPGLPWLDLCDERIEIRNPREFPVRGPFVGHERARQWEAEIWEVFRDLRHDLQEVIDGDGEKVVSVHRTRGKMRHAAESRCRVGDRMERWAEGGRSALRATWRRRTPSKPWVGQRGHRVGENRRGPVRSPQAAAARAMQ
jgi:hypothetical protein